MILMIIAGAQLLKTLSIISNPAIKKIKLIETLSIKAITWLLVDADMQETRDIRAPDIKKLPI